MTDRGTKIDTIKLIITEYIDKAIAEYKDTVCELKHKEVSELKENVNAMQDDIKKLYQSINGKFTKLTIAIIATLLALMGNLLLKSL